MEEWYGLVAAVLTIGCCPESPVLRVSVKGIPYPTSCEDGASTRVLA
jgi:hypothetical protein